MLYHTARRETIVMGIEVDTLVDHGPELYWDSTYAIALALIEHYPDTIAEDVGLNELADLVEALPGFCDDPALANERILLDIQFAWYEEATDL
jgi:FeS assembly protein IscX